MPVNTENSLYKVFYPIWEKVRTAIAGEEAVKAGRTKWLPSLAGTEQEDYNAYLERASYFNGPGRTLQGMTGLIFKNPPTITRGDGDAIDDVPLTQNGEGLEIYAKKIVEEQGGVGRVGLYATLPDRISSDVDPYATHYRAESIINWRTIRLQGSSVPTMVVLHEVYDEQKPKDGFEVKTKTQYRVLALVPRTYTVEDLAAAEPNNIPLIVAELEESMERFAEEGEIPAENKPVFAVLVYRQKEDQSKQEDQWYIYSVTTPIIRGLNLDYIPFVVCNINTLGFNAIEKPVLLSQVNVALSAYRTSADLETGRHFTGLPQACTAGFDVKPGDQLVIGSGSAWNAEDNQAKSWYLEFEGKGLESLEKALETKTAQMAVLGSRILEEPKKAVESADTHTKRRLGEESNIASMAGTAERAMTRVVKWILEWRLEPTEGVRVNLNKDFTAPPLESDFMSAMEGLVHGQLVSFDTFFYQMDKRGMYPEGTSMAEEKDRISEGGPMSRTTPGMDLDIE